MGLTSVVLACLSFLLQTDPQSVSCNSNSGRFCVNVKLSELAGLTFSSVILEYHSGKNVLYEKPVLAQKRKPVARAGMQLAILFWQ